MKCKIKNSLNKHLKTDLNLYFENILLLISIVTVGLLEIKS